MLQGLRRAVARTRSGTETLTLREVVHEGEHRLIGPVQVLDDDDGRAGGGQTLKEGAPGGEVLLTGGFLRLETQERTQAGAEAVAVGALGEDRLQARLGARHAVTLQDAGRVAHDLARAPRR